MPGRNWSSEQSDGKRRRKKKKERERLPALLHLRVWFQSLIKDCSIYSGELFRATGLYKCSNDMWRINKGASPMFARQLPYWSIRALTVMNNFRRINSKYRLSNRPRFVVHFSAEWKGTNDEKVVELYSTIVRLLHKYYAGKQQVQCVEQFLLGQRRSSPLKWKRKLKAKQQLLYSRSGSNLTDGLLSTINPNSRLQTAATANGRPKFDIDIALNDHKIHRRRSLPTTDPN